ncbi:NodT family efflux transporter outer membrane factor (OMF) lipoprotein [Paraburkholderia sp. BL6665CI2N2]|uniref:efflux transporter outer membrane subunit n=1 Tax=Paraburkholderia sp. BL6665CI2N2 TaxID=1938806 RepID=UPI0010667814|nr:efflux transporter outer membrane subunit [Paraburkholderia sp. BL6665CI2N2]TDY21310.1 NodT family efflux transporter outer membrane factor (OMF) lipoprotein [Paraburkholderia sp. BL6665CI2N2]
MKSPIGYLSAVSVGMRCCACALGATLWLSGCAVGPDYHQPAVAIPTQFKEAGTQWRLAAPSPQASLSSRWWDAYDDPELSRLVDAALQSNQSIAGAAAAYRLAQATVAADRASLFPTLGVDASASHSSSTTNQYAKAEASWEVDLWGGVRRQIESGKANAQGADATLAGERLSIAATLATDYFDIRQLDIDIDLLRQQEAVNGRILAITRAALAQGTASQVDLLYAQDTQEAVVANLQISQTSREQDEHAIAALTGVPPASLSIAPRLDYVFREPEVPSVLPSALLERRPDVVSAERTAAAANALIGVEKAAFFPDLDLSAQGLVQHNTFATLFSLPTRMWSLGPSLAATLFDGGARVAAVHKARATYDEDVASYREAVLTAFQNVEDSLSSLNHLRQQEHAFADIYQRNRQLLESVAAQLTAGTASEQSDLNQQVTLLTARQNLNDTQGALAKSDVGLVKNLGGGWTSSKSQAPIP